MPRVSGLDYHGECRRTSTTLRTGGDFFDFISLDDSNLAISFGELSGAGTGSQVLISGLRASLRGFAESGHSRISATVHALNRTICDLSPDEMYARLFYARLDAAARELTYVGAAQEPVLLVRRHPMRVRRLESTGAIMGLSRRSEYRQRSISLEPGDLLVAASGGLADALDPAGRPWSEAGLLEAVSHMPDAGAAALAQEIMLEVERFTRNAEPLQDRTVAVVRFHDRGAETIFEAHTAEPAFAAA